MSNNKITHNFLDYLIIDYLALLIINIKIVATPYGITPYVKSHYFFVSSTLFDKEPFLVSLTYMTKN